MNVDLKEDLEELVSAEEFLDYFEIPYDATRVHVNRLHILQRFHDYMQAAKLSDDEAICRAELKAALARAYEDFCQSTPQEEKIFKVFQQAAGEARVTIDKIGGRQA